MAASVTPVSHSPHAHPAQLIDGSPMSCTTHQSAPSIATPDAAAATTPAANAGSAGRKAGTSDGSTRGRGMDKLLESASGCRHDK